MSKFNLREKRRFSLRKYSVGLCSVVLGTILFAVQTNEVKADTINDSAKTEIKVEKQVQKPSETNKKNIDSIKNIEKESNKPDVLKKTESESIQQVSKKINNSKTVTADVNSIANKGKAVSSSSQLDEKKVANKSTDDVKTTEVTLSQTKLDASNDPKTNAMVYLAGVKKGDEYEITIPQTYLWDGIDIHQIADSIGAITFASKNKSPNKGDVKLNIKMANDGNGTIKIPFTLTNSTPLVDQFGKFNRQIKISRNDKEISGGGCSYTETINPGFTNELRYNARPFTPKIDEKTDVTFYSPITGLNYASAKVSGKIDVPKDEGFKFVDGDNGITYDKDKGKLILNGYEWKSGESYLDFCDSYDVKKPTVDYYTKPTTVKLHFDADPQIKSPDNNWKWTQEILHADPDQLNHGQFKLEVDNTRDIYIHGDNNQYITNSDFEFNPPINYNGKPQNSKYVLEIPDSIETTKIWYEHTTSNDIGKVVLHYTDGSQETAYVDEKNYISVAKDKQLRNVTVDLTCENNKFKGEFSIYGGVKSKNIANKTPYEITARVGKDLTTHGSARFLDYAKAYFDFDDNQLTTNIGDKEALKVNSNAEYWSNSNNIFKDEYVDSPEFIYVLPQTVSRLTTLYSDNSYWDVSSKVVNNKNVLIYKHNGKVKINDVKSIMDSLPYYGDLVDDIFNGSDSGNIYFNAANAKNLIDTDKNPLTEFDNQNCYKIGKLQAEIIGAGAVVGKTSAKGNKDNVLSKEGHSDWKKSNDLNYTISFINGDTDHNKSVKNAVVFINLPQKDGKDTFRATYKGLKLINAITGKEIKNYTVLTSNSISDFKDGQSGDLSRYKVGGDKRKAKSIAIKIPELAGNTTARIQLILDGGDLFKQIGKKAEITSLMQAQGLKPFTPNPSDIIVSGEVTVHQKVNVIGLDGKRTTYDYGDVTKELGDTLTQLYPDDILDFLNEKENVYTDMYHVTNTVDVENGTPTWNDTSAKNGVAELNKPLEYYADNDTVDYYVKVNDPVKYIYHVLDVSDEQHPKEVKTIEFEGIKGVPLDPDILADYPEVEKLSEEYAAKLPEGMKSIIAQHYLADMSQQWVYAKVPHSDKIYYDYINENQDHKFSYILGSSQGNAVSIDPRTYPNINYNLDNLVQNYNSTQFEVYLPVTNLKPIQVNEVQTKYPTFNFGPLNKSIKPFDKVDSLKQDYPVRDYATELMNLKFIANAGSFYLNTQTNKVEFKLNPGLTSSQLSELIDEYNQEIESNNVPAKLSLDDKTGKITLTYDFNKLKLGDADNVTQWNKNTNYVWEKDNSKYKITFNPAAELEAWIDHKNNPNGSTSDIFTINGKPVTLEYSALFPDEDDDQVYFNIGTVKYTQKRKATIHYVDDDDNQKEVKVDKDILQGTIGDIVNVDDFISIPAGYEVDKKQLYPKKEEVTKDGLKDVTIHLKHKIDNEVKTKTVDYIVDLKMPDGTTQLVVVPIKLTRTISTDEVTHKVTESDWTSELTSVTAEFAPKPGYSYESDGGQLNKGKFVYELDKDKIKNGTLEGKTLTIKGTAENQNTEVRYIDKSTKDVISSKSIKGVTDEDTGYTTKGEITDLINNKGYILVSDDTSGKNIVLKANGPKEYKVYLKHGTENVSRDKEMTRTIKYQDENGKSVAKDKVQKVTIHQTGTKDKVTGQVKWDEKTRKFRKIKSPEKSGYTPEKSYVDSLTVDYDSENQVEKVIYKANPQSTQVQYIDKQTGKLLSTKVLNGVTGEDTGYTTKAEITDLVNNKGYVLVSDDTNGKNVVLKTNKPKEYKVYLDHGTESVSRDKEITRIIKYQDENGKSIAKDKVQKVTIHQTGTKDRVTGTIGWNKVSKKFNDIKSPEKSGYTPDKSTVVGSTIQYSDQDQTIKVIYKANTQSAKLRFYDDTDYKFIESTLDLTVKGKTNTDISFSIPSKYDFENYDFKFVTDVNGKKFVGEKIANVKYGRFDSNDKKDQVFIMHFKHKITDVEEHADVQEVIHYVYDNGDTALPDYKSKNITFTRKGEEDLVTGETSWNNWIQDDLKASFIDQDVPNIFGYSANKEVVIAPEINVKDLSSQNLLSLEETVYYSKVEEASGEKQTENEKEPESSPDVKKPETTIPTKAIEEGSIVDFKNEICDKKTNISKKIISSKTTQTHIQNNGEVKKSENENSQKQLPQTGSKENKLGFIGLAIASGLGMFKVFDKKKRKN